jgi:hypothetical protein
MLMDSRTEDFLRILRQGALVFAYSAQEKFPKAFKKSEFRSCKQEGIITIQAWKLKFFIFFENSCGAKPPSNKYIKKGKNQKLTKSLNEAGRGRSHLTSS